MTKAASVAQLVSNPASHIHTVCIYIYIYIIYNIYIYTDIVVGFLTCTTTKASPVAFLVSILVSISAIMLVAHQPMKRTLFSLERV